MLVCRFGCDESCDGSVLTINRAATRTASMVDSIYSVSCGDQGVKVCMEDWRSRG
jgi:hypothetical protein